MPVGSSELLSGITEIWRKHKIIPEDSLQQFEQAGFFSYSVSPEIRIISLNTLYYFTSWCNKNNTICDDDDAIQYEDDPASQFQWLINELEHCKTQNQR